MTELRKPAILLRLTAAEKKAIDAAAKAARMQTAVWLRILGLKAARAAKGHTMKTILVAAILGLAACGGTEQIQEQQPAGRSPASATCETLLDAGTQCAPCPGASQQYQTERSPGDVIRWCVCPNGSYMNWPACPGGLTCAHALALWNNLCQR